MSRIPLSLYIHFPWCLRKCPYCDFNSYSLPKFEEQELLTVYANKLLADFATEALGFYGCELSSIYFGGGTPSLLASRVVKEIINRARNCFFLFLILRLPWRQIQERSILNFAKVLKMLGLIVFLLEYKVLVMKN